MKKLYVIQSVLSVVGTLLIAWIVGSWYAAASFGIGAAVVFFNVVALAWAGRRLIQKKRLALSSLLIIFKYAILGAILYKVLKTPWVMPLWFCAGVGTLMLSSVVLALDSEGETQCP